jgi:serine/threonine-protein kinase
LKSVLDRWNEIISDLRRRRVFRAAGLYWIGALAVLGALDLVRDLLPWLDSIFPAIVLSAILLFPLVMGLAWVFEWTPEGLRVSRAGPNERLGRGQKLAIFGALTLASLTFGWSVLSLWARAEGVGVAGTLATIAGPGGDPNRIAVLYFEDDSRDAGLTYLADGLTEGLIDALGSVEDLQVTSRNGVRPFRSTPASSDSIARHLGVGTLVTGSVYGEAGQGVRVRAQLVDVTSGDRQLWSGSFEGTAEDVLALQSEMVVELSRRLRENLGIAVRERESALETTNDRAWSLYHEGRHLVSNAKRPDLPVDEALALMDQAEVFLTEAHDLDPGWAAPVLERGWLAVERSQLLSPVAGAVRGADSVDLLGEAALAMEVSDSSAAALELRGVVQYELAESLGEGDRWRLAAEDDLRRAIRLQPRRAQALAYLGRARRFAGDFNQARSYAERAMEVDAYLEEADQVIELLYSTNFELKRWSEADRWCREGRRRYDRSLSFVFCRLQFEALGPEPPSPREAWALSDTIRSLAYPEDWDLAYRTWAGYKVATVLARNALADSAAAVIDAHRPPEDDGFFAYDEAYVWLLLGDDGRALELLDSYLDVRPDRRAYLPSDWLFESLWDDPRFVEMTSAGAGNG